MALVILEIPDVKGESQVKNFEQMIICDSFAQDTEMEIDATMNQRRTFHVPKINNFSLERKMDLASAQILKKMLTGAVDKNTWIIHFFKAAGDNENMQVEFLKITIEKPILAKHSMTINDGEPTETFEINATKITWAYTQFKEDNSKGGSVTFSFEPLKGIVGGGKAS
jgi:type VI protein secretion system component Hcp